MLRLFRQFVALLLTIWLPLFSGNALAVSIGMQSGGCGNHANLAQSGELHAHHVSAQQRHTIQAVANQEQAAGHCAQQDGQPEHQDSSCTKCGVCHLASCGYLAAIAVELAEAQTPAQSFPVGTTRFQSIVLTPLDPPPLARA